MATNVWYEPVQEPRRQHRTAEPGAPHGAIWRVIVKKLELIREEKLFRIIPGRSRNSRLEASGVALATESTAFVVFDNLNQIASVDISLKRSRRNALWPAPSLGAGFEDVAADAKARIHVRADRIGRGHRRCVAWLCR